MAAVLSNIVTNSSYYPNMGHEERRTSTSSSHQQSSRSQSRPPPSPKQQPSQAVPLQPAANKLITPATSSQHVDSRNAFASQQNFASFDSSRTAYTSAGVPPSHVAGPRSAPLASPAPSNSPLHRSPWSSDDLSKYGGSTIQVRDLAHIQEFATEDFLSRRNSHGRRKAGNGSPMKYEISAMPIGDVIEMVAGLLTKITTTNDHQHKSAHENLPTAEHAASMPGLASSVLAFHGKNVPSITILSYLTRIHKYCPTTYEVFLSLLVYFDRMTERVNAGQISVASTSASTAEVRHNEEDATMSSAASSATDLEAHAQVATPPDEEHDAYDLSHFFVVDSFNIHRLVIAGVTCASKFFSDVFYTNSRYAKVGGLPLAELNHLELQFLLLNDFRLNVPVEELEAYGTMLVEFYAREVIAQKRAASDEEYDDVPIEAADSD